MQMQAIGALADHDALFGQRDFRIHGVGEIGEENAFPHCRSLTAVNVLHVEDALGKSFVENSRVNLE